MRTFGLTMWLLAVVVACGENQTRGLPESAVVVDSAPVAVESVPSEASSDSVVRPVAQPEPFILVSNTVVASAGIDEAGQESMPPGAVRELVVVGPPNAAVLVATRGGVDAAHRAKTRLDGSVKIRLQVSGHALRRLSAGPVFAEVLVRIGDREQVFPVTFEFAR